MGRIVLQISLTRLREVWGAQPSTKDPNPNPGHTRRSRWRSLNHALGTLPEEVQHRGDDPILMLFQPQPEG
jgi:hypothetical protein